MRPIDFGAPRLLLDHPAPTDEHPIDREPTLIIRRPRVTAVAVVILLAVVVLGARPAPVGAAAWPGRRAAHGVREAVPANSNASPAARSLLAYLAGLSKATRRVIPGEFMGYGNSASLHAAHSVHVMTGQWLGIAGFDYNNFSQGVLTTVTNQLADEWWDDGGLVMLGPQSLFNPITGADNDGSPHPLSAAQRQAILTPGTAANRAFYQELDVVAGALQQLQRAGVVVIYRPFSEMNGFWFWWGTGRLRSSRPCGRTRFGT